MVLAKNKAVHYHANFALFVNGKRETFDNFTFYEEEAACDLAQADNPKHNAHMHDKVNDLIHVHASAVTWGAFFANIGFTLGNKVVTTENGVFVDGQDGNRLQFILNGTSITSAENRVIKSEDALLISYGPDDATGLTDQYKQIKHSAAAANASKDPAGCGGSATLTLSERFKRAFDFTK